MTSLGRAELRVAVASAGQIAGQIDGTVAGGSEIPGQIEGAVSRTILEAYDHRAVFLHTRVLLDGEDVTRDLVGPIETRQADDEPVLRGSLTLAGRRYSPAVTRKTWTRTAIEIRSYRGPAPVGEPAVELEGFVVSCSPAGRDTYRVEFGDHGIAFLEADACYELPPLMGLTRGQIAASIAASAGILKTDIPDGAVFRGPVQVDGQRVYTALRDFGEPEGWRWRWVGDTLTAYVPALKTSPQAPDHAWHLRDLLESPHLVPPEALPSRRVVRAFAVVEADSGIETETLELEVRAPYAPKVADAVQDSAGQLTPTGLVTQEEERVVKRLIDTTKRRDGQVFSQETVEHGWINPAAAQYTTGSPVGSGPVDAERLGLYWRGGAFFEGGRCVAWQQEKFREIGRRQQVTTYDAAENPERLEVRTWSYHRRRRASGQVGLGNPSISHVAVGDDGLSYIDVGHQIDLYDLSNHDVTTYVYDPQTGAEREQRQVSFGWASPRTALVAPRWFLADGTAMLDASDRWLETHREVKSALLDRHGRLVGESFALWSYGFSALAAGTYDWGKGEFSHELVEKFRLERLETKEVQVDSPEAHSVVRYDGNRRRLPERHSGRPPIPRYESSAWTRLRRQPIELTVEDPVLEAWFGFRRRVDTSEQLQSPEEAAAWLEREIAREHSLEASVQRPTTLGKVGDTVLLIDPVQGVHDRFLIVEIAQKDDLAAVSSIATYTLIAPR